MANLSNCLVSGAGLPANLDLAIGLQVEAARLGRRQAKRILGLSAIINSSASQDFSAAGAGLLLAAAEEGDHVAAMIARDAELNGDVEDVGTSRPLNERALNELERGLGDAIRNRAAPVVENITDRPRLRLSPGFLHPLERAYLIHLSSQFLSDSRVSSGSQRHQKMEDVRSSLDCHYSRHRQDLVIRGTVERICAATQRPATHGEALSVVNYGPGGQFLPHLDAEASSLAHGPGDRDLRTTTFIAYLNDDYDGGETIFVGPRLKIRGKAGDAIFFENLDCQGEIDTESMHAGSPVIRGNKWIAVQWFRSTETQAKPVPTVEEMRV
ncbi:prolyl hydroxylase family protein [Maricaulis sp. D1M11]|uniref:prolyl hydroxylase family protein n=1 Tax=Maricaulis sp. D1M11 TaxID=3076117 RepID=UPI0039B3E3BF